MSIAVIIIGHDTDASLSRASRALSDVYDTVKVASLDGIEQSFSDAVASCRRSSLIIVVPYLLETSPEQIRILESAVTDATRDGGPNIRLAPPVGFDTRLVDILEDRVTTTQNESSEDRNVPIITVERHDGAKRDFSVSDLLELPDRLDDIGHYVPDRLGEAVSVDALLSASALVTDESTATFKSGDEFSADVNLRTVRDRGWLVFWLKGAPLPARHGGPVRLFIPEFDNRCANVKAVDRMIIR